MLCPLVVYTWTHSDPYSGSHFEFHKIKMLKMFHLYLFCFSLFMLTAVGNLINERECNPVSVDEQYTLILNCPFKGTWFYILQTPTPTPTSLSKLKTIKFEHLDANSGIRINLQGLEVIIENGDIDCNNIINPGVTVINNILCASQNLFRYKIKCMGNKSFCQQVPVSSNFPIA